MSLKCGRSFQRPIYRDLDGLLRKRFSVSVEEIQAVLFDLDGTLVDARDRLLLSCRQALHQLELGELDETAYWEAFQSYNVGKLVPVSMQEQFFALLLHGYSTYTGHVRLIPGAIEALRFCREQGYGTAVITGRPTSSAHVRAELERVGLAPFIDVIKTQEGMVIPAVLTKDHRLLEAIEELRTVPERSLYVGDLPDDISSARRAGLRLSVAVLSGGIHRDLLALREPDVILNSVGELPEYLIASHRATETTENI
ncbi:MAG: HAD family hydrolase [Acidobacteria bacterium]|nr:HAD family hydrolase [Acidobacteriota bacterium]